MVSSYPIYELDKKLLNLTYFIDFVSKTYIFITRIERYVRMFTNKRYIKKSKNGHLFTNPFI